MSNQKGFSKVAIIIIVLILIGGAYFVFIKREKNIPTQDNENQNSQSSKSSSENSVVKNNQQIRTKVTSFKEHGDMINNNSIWYFTVSKYDSKSDSWSKEGPFKLKFTENSMCQSTRVKSIKCTDFSLLNNYYNSIEIEGTKDDAEISVSKLTMIQ